MKDCKATISGENAFCSIPAELHPDWAHLAKWALDDKRLLATVINTAKLPLHLILVAHVVVVIDRFLRSLEMSRESAEVEELQLLSHLLDLALVHHFLLCPG